MTGISRSKFSEANNSRFEIGRYSPTKTDKSCILLENTSVCKPSDLSGIHEVLDRIDQIENKNKQQHLRHRKDAQPVITIANTETRNTKLSIHNKDHPMNLSVSSLNSVSKSREDSRIGMSHTPNSDLKNTRSVIRMRKIKKSHSPIGKYILGRQSSLWKKLNDKDSSIFCKLSHG